MRKPVDEVASYVIASLMAEIAATGSAIISLPPHEEVVSIIKGFVSWAKANNRLEGSKLDISNLL